MSATVKERHDFIASMQREFPTERGIMRLCERMMRMGASYLRLQEAQCNGDYPADNGERKTKACSVCGLYWAPSSFKVNGDCPDCRAEKNIKALCQEFPEQVEPIFQGDPRGATIKLKVPSGRTEDWGQVGICVPTS